MLTKEYTEIRVKVLKKDWKNLVKDFKKAKSLKLDKIFRSQAVLPCYKSPKKIERNQLVRAEQMKAPAIAIISNIEASLLSRHYIITIKINEKGTAGKVIKANIQKEAARMIFELWYDTISNQFCINTFALVDNDNLKAKSTITKVRF